MKPTNQQRRRSFGSRGVLLVFSICALADFVWTLLEKRSVAEAAVSAVLGLFGTASICSYTGVRKRPRKRTIATTQTGLREWFPSPLLLMIAVGVDAKRLIALT